MAYYFKLPLLTEMTTVQQSTLNETKPVAINGGPGTGKSVVSLWRHIRNHSIGTKESLLLTYTKTLQFCLASWATAEDATAGQHVDRTLIWLEGNTRKYDEIIVDEAQDLKHDKYNLLSRFSKSISYGADDQQILFPSQAITQNELKTLFPLNEPFELDQNFRNSYEILRFVKATFPKKLIAHNILSDLKVNRMTGILPKCMFTGGYSNKQLQGILDIINQFKSDTHNIGILMPKVKHVDNMHSFLIKNKVKSSSYHNERISFTGIENVHVTTFKSCKGIEFDTVIIPDFTSYKSNIATLSICEENDYYVALTRAKRNLYLFCHRKLSEIDSSTYEIINL